jgi:small subunit ribosomal protein S3
MYEAKTTFGRIGVKVWIYKGDVVQSLAEREAAQALRPGRARPVRPRRDRPADRPDRGGARDGVAPPAPANDPAAEAPVGPMDPAPVEAAPVEAAPSTESATDSPDGEV